MTRLILPLPPSKNASHHQTNEGGELKRRRTAETIQFGADAGWLCKAWMRKTAWKTPAKGEKVILRFWAFWPDRRKRDPANLVDALVDALKEIAYVDDQYVLPQAMDYDYDNGNPRVEVELVRMEAKANR